MTHESIDHPNIYNELQAKDEANVFIVASYANPFRSGYGVVIQHQNSIQELGLTDEDGPSAMRLLLIGCLAALRLIPEDMPVRVHCADEYLTRWTLPRLADLQAKGFKKTPRGQPVPSHDVMAELAGVVARRAGVESVVVPRAEWSDHHSRAEALALQHGGGDVPRIKPIAPVRRKAKPSPKASAIEVKADGTKVRDYGVDEDAPWA